MTNLDPYRVQSVSSAGLVEVIWSAHRVVPDETLSGDVGSNKRVLVIGVQKFLISTLLITPVIQWVSSDTVPATRHPLLVFERPLVKNVGWPGLARSVKVAAIGCTMKPSSGDAGRGNAIARVDRTFCALEAVVDDTIDFFGILLLVFTCLFRDRASDPEVMPICLPSTQPH
jgi:hypothetical protein